MAASKASRRRGCIGAAVVYVNPSVNPPHGVLPAPRPGSLLVQYKHGVQCRTPSRSDRFNGVTGVARGPKGRNRNLPWPPGKKVIKMLIFYLFVLLPQSRLRLDSSPASGGAFWCALQAHRLASLLEGGGFCEAKDGRSQPALKGDSSRARPVGDAARGESGGIGSIASGSVARRPYSNQRCGCECNEQTKGEQLGAAKCRKLFPFSQTFGLPAPWPGSILVQYKLPH